jgi:hypothetical protein
MNLAGLGFQYSRIFEAKTTLKHDMQKSRILSAEICDNSDLGNPYERVYSGKSLTCNY